MHEFHFGLVVDYEKTANGYRVVLDTGKSALIPLTQPIPDRFRSADFGLDFFDRNMGVALALAPGRAAVWHPANICAVLMGAFFRKDGLLLGMEEWSPLMIPSPSLNAPGAHDRCPAFQDGTITLGLAGVAASPYHLPCHMPGYVGAAALIKEAVQGITVTRGERVFTFKDADRNAIMEILGQEGVSVTLSRIDFAFNQDFEIIHVQRTKCPAQEFSPQS